jgi:hypothetical protein
MLQKPKCPVIALEEHYWDEELAAHAKAVERKADITNRLFDMGELRLKEMDEAGIDIQVISHGAPSAQKRRGSMTGWRRSSRRGPTALQPSPRCRPAIRLPQPTSLSAP